MANDAGQSGFSLRRWSQRKLAAGRRGDAPHADGGDNRAQPDPGDNLSTTARPVAASTAHDAAPAPVRPASAAEATVTATAHPAEAAAMHTRRAPAKADPLPLPPLESLTIDSDFSPFMQPGVDEALKRSALRKLLRHPRFNVMDGLDVYIDDYSKPSPLEPELVRTLAQARYLFNPPKTRVTAEGIVEDVPDEAPAADADGANDAEPASALPVVAASEVPAPAVPVAAADEDPRAPQPGEGESATVDPSDTSHRAGA